MQIVDKIKQLVNENGDTMAELERCCGFQPKSVYKWDKNTPSIDRVAKVARYLHVDVDYLIGLTPYRTRYEEWDARYNKDGQLTKAVKKLEALDIVAAHIDDNEVTDAQLKALELYIDALLN